MVGLSSSNNLGPLSQLHNGGLHVHLQPDGWIRKPRALDWEALLLGEDSPLKRVSALSDLDPLFATEVRLTSGSPLSGGTVRPYTLSAKPASVDWAHLGRVLALLTWIGVGDLHTFNCGWVGETNSKFVPLDIEVIFGNFILLSQMHLLPSPKVSSADCGLSWLYMIEGRTDSDLLASVNSYLLQWNELCGQRRQISTAIKSVIDLARTPIRVVVRPTRDYLRWAGGIEGYQPSELEQLRRGDVPYYFRTANSKELHWIGSGGGVLPAEAALNEAIRLDPQVSTYADFETIDRTVADALPAVFQFIRAFHSREPSLVTLGETSLNIQADQFVLRHGESTWACNIA